MNKDWIRSAKHSVDGRDLVWLLETQAEKFHDKSFLVWSSPQGDEEVISYAEFYNKVRRASVGLRANNVQSGQRVLVYLDNCPELLITLFACAYIGATVVLINTRSTQEDIQYFLQTTDAVGLITQPNYIEMTESISQQLRFCFVTSLDRGRKVSNAQPIDKYRTFDQLLLEDTASLVSDASTMRDITIQFTSGTTSRPKAVVWTHANLLHAGQQAAANLGLLQDDVSLVCLPLYHTLALSNAVMGTLWSGGTLLLQQKFSASNFWPQAVKHHATWTILVPFCINALKKQPVPQNNFRFWLGAYVSPDVTDVFNIPSLGCWGMTEMAWLPIISNRHQPDCPFSIGRPAPGAMVSVRRQDGTECDIGETGNLYVKGAPGVTMFRTYLNHPEAYAKSFDDEGWFATGDSLKISDDGSFIFGDRHTDIIKVGGENVSAVEIEFLLHRSGWVQECAVVAGPDAMLDEVPVAFVIPKQDAPGNLEEKLAEFCRSRLADFKMVRQIHIVNNLPRSTLEKISKKDLRKKLFDNGPI